MRIKIQPTAKVPYLRFVFLMYMGAICLVMFPIAFVRELFDPNRRNFRREWFEGMKRHSEPNYYLKLFDKERQNKALGIHGNVQ